VTDVIAEGSTGPGEVRCNQCRQFTLKCAEVNFVEFVGPEGRARVVGGTEEWECWTCWRQIVVRWSRPKEIA
jgi:hypothetical protein